MRPGWRIYAVWACFAARLLFYATMLPLWEGFDEWAHFSVIRSLSVRGVGLTPRDAAVPRDVAESLHLAPVPWELRAYPPPAMTQDDFWKLPAAERQSREAAFRAIPPQWRAEDGPKELTAYEALQPPLYYWMMAPVVRLLSGQSLPAQVMAVRWLSALLASLAIPLIYGVARAVFSDARLALGCAAVAALMPEWALDSARAGNDCLSVVFFTALLWFGLRLVEDGPVVRWAAGLGIVLGLGLLTKAWFLTALPPVVLLFVWLGRNGRTAAAAKSGALAMGTAAALSGWWYWHNMATTGTLAGLSESVMLRHASLSEMMSAAAEVPWLQAVDSVSFSHLYFGGWSSLTVRSWMYHLFYLMILAAAIGLFRMMRRPAVGWLLAVYLAFWAGQLYNVLLISMSKGVATSMGWYLYAVVAAEVALCAAGLRSILPEKAGNWSVAAGVLLFGLFDLYTVHAVAVPYYTGMIRHRPSGALAALHGADFQAVGWTEAVHRLTVFKGGMGDSAMVAMWLAYLAGTVFLVATGLLRDSPGSRRGILR